MSREPYRLPLPWIVATGLVLLAMCLTLVGQVWTLVQHLHLTHLGPGALAHRLAQYKPDALKGLVLPLLVASSLVSGLALVWLYRMARLALPPEIPSEETGGSS